MKFLIADTFRDSLNKLNTQEQKRTKTTAFDLQINPTNPGLQLHKLDRAKDKHFWSIRVNRDIRMIVHRSDSNFLLCYVDHHDRAYSWAEKRKLKTHPKTGAAQMVEIKESVEEIKIPKYVDTIEQTPSKPLLFTNYTDDDLLGYGLPNEWIEDVKNANEDTVLEIAEHLPTEAAEALLNLATGSSPQLPLQVPAETDPFDHPDAKRRFEEIGSTEELQRALDYPWEKWVVFLDPLQREIVERDYRGPFRVAGTAGTGKTIIALHRAVYLARKNPDSRILLTTISKTLANFLLANLRILVSSEPRLLDQIEVGSLNSVAKRLHKLNIGDYQLASKELIMELISKHISESNNKINPSFLINEWENIVDAHQLITREQYLDTAHHRRKTKFVKKMRNQLWPIFESLSKDLIQRDLITLSKIYTAVSDVIMSRKNSPFDFIIVDEAQDLSPAQLKFLLALGRNKPDGLFFAGDLGQRIFQQSFSWKSLGLDMRGRSRRLKINYRTSHQILMKADLLLGPQLADVDGNIEERSDTISLFNGIEPEIYRAESTQEEVSMVSKWLKKRISEGVLPSEIGLFIRSRHEISRAEKVAEKAEIPFVVLDQDMAPDNKNVSVCLMHNAKGLEFRCVAIMGCDNNVLPLKERIESVEEMNEMDNVFNTERYLFYIACTRARDFLVISATEPASMFLDDLER